MLARGGRVRRLVLVCAALPALAGACGWPGSHQVAAAVRCAVRPLAPPPAPDTPLPAVWRTHSMPAGYSIALPDYWDGLALGTANQEDRLAAVARRSPALLESLRRATGGRAFGASAYVAESTEGDRLDVGLTFGARYPVSCLGAPLLDALSRAHDTEIRETRFPAGDARLLSFHDDVDIDGQTYPFANWVFTLGAPGGQDLLLGFAVHREYEAARWPVVWAAMQTLRRAPGAAAVELDPQPACLYPDPAERALTARQPCAVQLGRRLGAPDCRVPLADPDRVMAAVMVPRGGGDSEPTEGDEGECRFTVPADKAVWLSAGPVAANLVAYVDIDFTVADQSIVSIDMRSGGGQGLSASVTPGGRVYVTEYGVGGAAATSLAETSVVPTSGAHRLVLSAVSQTLRVWFDGAGTARPAPTRVNGAGTAGIYLANQETGGASVVTILGGGVYAAG